MTSSSQLTYTGVLLAVLANQLCLPVPAIVFLMAAGALSAHGYMQASTVVLLSVLACLACGWALVLAWPEVGFTGHEATVPSYGRPAKMLRGMHTISSRATGSPCCVWPSSYPDSMASCRHLQEPKQSPHSLSRTGCDRQSHLVQLLRGGRVFLLRATGNRGGLGETLWNCPGPCDRCSILSLHRLARTDFDTNDSPTAGPPHQCADAASKA